MGDIAVEGLFDADIVGLWHAIPSLNPETGHLLPGRYRTTLDHIEQRFVQHPEFTASVTRTSVWKGFIDYLQAWKDAQAVLGEPILKTIWIAGSFISDVLDPEDIDVSPIYDEEVVGNLAGSPGIRKIKKLVGHRASLVREYAVEPFPIPWRSVESTLFPTTLPGHEQNYLAKRGGMDDWWQRIRPEGPKTAPAAPAVTAARGYLEVTW